jgi:hypothetical protein
MESYTSRKSLIIYVIILEKWNKYQFYVFKCFPLRPTFFSIVGLSYLLGFSVNTFTEFLNFKFYLFFKTLIFVWDCSVFILFKLDDVFIEDFLVCIFSSSFKVSWNGTARVWGCQSKPAKLYWYPTELLLFTCVSLYYLSF